MSGSPAMGSARTSAKSGIRYWKVAAFAAGFWLSFLARLGQRLGDRAFADAVRTYAIWFWVGLVVGLGGLATVLIAAAFCMYNRYVDGLGTLAPADPAQYGYAAERITQFGYVA